MAGDGITRRDFLNGVALGTAGALAPLELAAATDGDYPPLLTGMRGSHPGSFEVAHALAWAGQRYERPARQTDDDYDLVVVGGGISGLAAAHFWRRQAGPDASILVLDNHDDFGGHAKRNEFEVGGRRLIGYGGSQALDTPSAYSAESRQLLLDVGIDVQRFYDWYDADWHSDRGLQRGIYFSDAKTIAPNVLGSYGRAVPDDLAGAIARYPLPAAAKQSLAALLAYDGDPFPALARAQKRAHLASISYSDYLRGPLGVDERIVRLLRDSSQGLWGIGYDALSALEGWRNGMPGFAGLSLEPPATDMHGQGDEPYIFHFPDGNAGVARALVRSLLPRALPGNTPEELVENRVRYDELDRRGSTTRIRLSATAVDARHGEDGRSVDVTYVRDGAGYRVRGRHVVMACYSSMLPYLCPELPLLQREALDYAEKVPLVYSSVAVRNWRPWQETGYHSLYVPDGRTLNWIGLDFPVSIGSYRFTSSPDEPTVLHGSWAPAVPDQGLTGREQHLAGRRKLYQLAFADFERDIVDTLAGAFGEAGFDAGRDIAAITVNRWPHGYAYEYNELFDPAGFSPANGPHVAGRAQVGRISMANSDAAGYAYVDGAIDAAHRAVQEQLRTG